VSILQSPIERRKRLPRAERDAKILALRSIGQAYSQIVEKVGCSDATARRVVARHLAELQTEIRTKAAEIRANHLLELRNLRARLAKGVAQGDVKAITAWLRVQERESRLLGLDLAQPAADEAAAHNAAQALLQRLADNLDPETMNTIVGILSINQGESDANE
jgi:hypothetical protein